MVNDKGNGIGEWKRMKEIKSYFAFSASWGPPADVYEDDKEIRIVVDIAGINPDQLEEAIDLALVQTAGRDNKVSASLAA